MQKYLGGIGKISVSYKNCKIFGVTSRNDISKYIIPHFEKYPLISQKKADFDFFKSIVAKMNNGDHLTSEGIQEIVNIRATLNRGLSEELREAFPNTIPVARRLIDEVIPDPQ